MYNKINGKGSQLKAFQIKIWYILIIFKGKCKRFKIYILCFRHSITLWHTSKFK